MAENREREREGAWEGKFEIKITHKNRNTERKESVWVLCKKSKYHIFFTVFSLTLKGVPSSSSSSFSSSLPVRSGDVLK
jgi:hypothetical protein